MFHSCTTIGSPLPSQWVVKKPTQNRLWGLFRPQMSVDALCDNTAIWMILLLWGPKRPHNLLGRLKTTHLPKSKSKSDLENGTEDEWSLYIIFQVFIPCSLLVFASWINFFAKISPGEQVSIKKAKAGGNNNNNIVHSTCTHILCLKVMLHPLCPAFSTFYWAHNK